MQLSFQIREAWINFRVTKLRSFLAVLGILIGTASVVSMLSGGKIATAQVLKQFKSLGTDLMAVHLMTETQHSTQTPITLNQLLTLETQQMIRMVAPYQLTYRLITLPHNKMEMIGVIGATEQFAKINKLALSQGRLIYQVDGHAPYAVLGANLYQKLRHYTFSNILGQPIMIDHRSFTIVGIMKPAENNPFVFQNINDSIIVPLQTLMNHTQDRNLHSVLLQLTPNANIDQVQNDIIYALKRYNPTIQLNFHSAKRLIAGMIKQKQVLTLFLGFIGSIALLVGGIGVMNIMLVSVSERRQEIGIRMAIGAKRRDIQLLFLIEAVTLAMIGGVMGIISGIFITALIAYLNHWQFILFLSPMLLGFSVSVLTGIFFGCYPAFKASRVDPITCLHAE